MDKKFEIASSASHLFARESLRGIGVDHISAAVGASTRTLYKHFGSRDGLVLAALEARHGAFMDVLRNTNSDNSTIESLFDTLGEWLEKHGASGCLLLRASYEYGQENADIVTLVRHQKEEFLKEIAKRVHHVLGYENTLVSSQIWILFEGATAIAGLQNLMAIRDAKAAALSLIASAGGAY